MPNNMPTLDRRSYLKATGAGLAGSALAGCLGDDDDDSILISSLQPFSGPFAQYGPRHERGADWAIERINDDGGVLDGRELEIDHVDTESVGEEAATAFINHIDDGAVAGIGPGSSDAAVLAGEVANDDNVPLFLHAAGASANTPPENEYVFRTNLAATPQAALSAAELVEERGLNKGAVIYEDGEWGDEFSAGVEAYFPDDIEIHEDTAPIPESDFTPMLRDIPDDIEFFLGTGHPPGVAQIYPQLIDVGLEVDLYTAAITPLEADYEELGSEMMDMDYASFNHVDFYSDTYADIAQEYYDDTNDVFDTAQAGGYVAIELIREAIEEAGEADPEAIREELVAGEFDPGVFTNPIEYTSYGEIDNVVQIWSSIEEGDSPDHWPDLGFSPRLIHRTEPIPAYAHELDT